MALLDSSGRCPGCDGVGSIGASCPERACERAGRAFVPEADAARVHARPGPPDPWVGTRVGEYLITSLLGEGGFSRVYVGLQLPIGMRVAVKLLKSSALEGRAGKSILRKFQGEAEALARLHHPNIVRLLKYGLDGDAPYLVMELVEDGRSLDAEIRYRVASGRGFGDDEVRTLLRQILNALEAAHAAHVVHRDLKPENVLVQRVVGEPIFARVVDFGLAKYVRERNSSTQAMGTPMYMAPEQATGQNLGPWTDVYALAVLICELLYGRSPFGGDSPQEIVLQKMDPAYDPATIVAASGGGEEEQTFFRRALARVPAERIRSAAELRTALGPLLDRALAHPDRRAGIDLSGLYGLWSDSGAVPTLDEGRTLARIPAEPARAPFRQRSQAAPPPPASPTTADAPSQAAPLAPDEGIIPTLPLSRNTLIEAGAVAPAAAAEATAAGARPTVILPATGPQLGGAAAAAADPAVPVDWLIAEAGTFHMGADPEDGEAARGEEPRRVVAITRPLLVKAAPVTRAEWTALMGTDLPVGPRTDPAGPADELNWYEALSWCNALSRRLGLPEAYAFDGADDKARPGRGWTAARVRFAGVTSPGYRLPTEAEWEFLARASLALDGAVAAGERTLQGMMGEVAQWVWDVFDVKYYATRPALDEDPTGPDSGTFRVHRGFDWMFPNDLARPSHRRWANPTYRRAALGFRPVRTVAD